MNVRLSWVSQTLVPQRDKPDDLSGDIPWLRIEDFDGKYLEKSKSGQGVTRAQVASMPLRAFPPRTVVTSCSCTMGATAIAARELVTNQTFIGLVPDERVLLADYLMYVILAKKDELQARASGAIQQYLSQDEFRAIRFGLPSIEEQRRIANFLDDQVSRIDKIVGARQVQEALFEETVRAKLADILLTSTGSTVPIKRLITDERLGVWGSEPGEVGVDVRVARVADFERKTFGLRPVETVRSVEPSQVRSRILVPGDVLLERSGGTNRNPVGCPAFVADVDGPTVSSNFVSRMRPLAGVSDGRYISLVLGAMYWTRRQAPFSTQTTGIQNLDSAAYLSTSVPERTYDEQVALAREGDMAIAEALHRRATLASSISRLMDYRQSLITAAVTGELDVTTASKGYGPA